VFSCFVRPPGLEAGASGNESGKIKSAAATENDGLGAQAETTAWGLRSEEESGGRKSIEEKAAP
jgi:hypothetical protein